MVRCQSCGMECAPDVGAGAGLLCPACRDSRTLLSGQAAVLREQLKLALERGLRMRVVCGTRYEELFQRELSRVAAVAHAVDHGHAAMPQAVDHLVARADAGR